MPRYVSFLRGINVGGHRVKMDELRRHFVALKFTGVETFIASGNVIFETASTDAAALENRIERHLARALGYEVPTVVRTLPELAAIVRHRPFVAADMDEPGFSRYVFFLRHAPELAVVQALAGLRSKFDEFCAHEREIHWLCRGKISQVSLAWQPFEKLLKSSRTIATSRNITTVRQLVEIHPPTEQATPATVARKPAVKRRA